MTDTDVCAYCGFRVEDPCDSPPLNSCEKADEASFNREVEKSTIKMTDTEILDWLEVESTSIDMHGDPDNFVRIWYYKPGPKGNGLSYGRSLRNAVRNAFGEKDE